LIDRIIEEDLQHLDKENPDILEGKRILVTGGAGFIGSWIADCLIRKKAFVTVLDDFSTGQSGNVDHLLKETHFSIQKIKAEDLAIENETYNYILHLAGRPAPDDFQEHPVETALSNSLGTYRVLELARKCDATAFFASSSEVYGQAEIIPTPETYRGSVNILGPRACYDESKRFGEALFMAYRREYGLDARIARIFNTYGPRLRSDGLYARAISRFIAQSLTGDDVTVYGDGSQMRSFCYVTDTVAAILKMLSLKGLNTPLNIGNTAEASILQVAKRIIQLAASDSRIVFRELPPDDPKRRCPDTTVANSLLAWEPNVSLDRGLERTIQWFKTNKMSRG
jgi:UDP-glucuronate decarboxylase